MVCPAVELPECGVRHNCNHPGAEISDVHRLLLLASRSGTCWKNDSIEAEATAAPAGNPVRWLLAGCGWRTLCLEERVCASSIPGYNGTLMSYAATRKIVHIDMDCFYAQVEERNNPELKNKPVIIGGPSSTRGVVCAANYTARKFGVGSGQSTYEAFRKCPSLALIHPDFELYRRVSSSIHAIFVQYTQKVQAVGLDEAYLDLTGVKACQGSATRIAQQIMTEIWDRTQLTCSAGVSFNKLVAKIASDWNKPNGICVVTPAQRLEFMGAVPVRKIPGIGPNSAQLLTSIDLMTAQDVMECPLRKLSAILGINKATRIYHFCHGICHSEVEPFRPQKTFTSETTYYEPLQHSDLVQAVEDLSMLFHRKFSAMDRAHLFQRKIAQAVLKCRDQHFRTKTRTLSLTQFESKYLQEHRAWPGVSLARLTQEFERLVNPDAGIRLLGLGVRFEDSHPEQLELRLTDESC